MFGRGFIAKALLALLFAFVSAGIAAAQERILAYSSNVLLLEDGTVDVTETIRVRAEGRSIRRGIFRDIPTTLRNDDGTTLRSNLNVVSISKDGAEEPYFTRTIDNGLRIYIGEEDVFLAHGEYTYTIRYTMTRMARRFETHDELYWNATGNFWAFPIEKAVAQVTLPDGAQITELVAYTGPQGSSQSSATFRKDGENRAIFRATGPLGSFEGMSIAVLFEKGALAELSSTDQLGNFVSDHRETIFPTLVALLVLVYYWSTWNAVGRDPKKGVIVPLFYPPEGMSPALVHYVHRMGWKGNGWTAFSAALVSLATKGLIEIDRSNEKETAFHHSREPAATLPPGEKVIDRYIRGKGTLQVNKSNGRTILSKLALFKKAITDENRTLYFNNNALYSVGGVFLSVVLVMALAVFEVIAFEYVIVAVFAGIFLGVVSGMLASFVNSNVIMRFVGLFVIGIAVMNMFSMGVAALSQIDIEFGLIAVASIAIINAVFIFLMRAPTVQGRQIMDQIDGFKLYLETAEKERLKFIEEPDFSIARFEQVLPYAIALGVEEKWGDRLAGELARHAIDDSASGYNPHWYSGSRFGANSMGRDIAGIASGVTSSMISSVPASSSSSGGGGGGFSGGGGGGGGGGGW